MADIDIDRFGEHNRNELSTDEPTDEHIPLIHVYVYSDHSILECYNLFSGVELSMRSFFVIPGVGGSTWEPGQSHASAERGEQETSFGGESQRTKLMKDYVKDLYKKLSENIGEASEQFHYDYFELKGGELYYIGNRKPLTAEGKLKQVGMIADILGKNRLRRLGFNIPVGKVTARQAVMLNKAAEELPSESDITRADDIELQETVEKASKSTEDLIFQINNQSQTDDLFEHPLCNLLGLDAQLRSIRGSLKVEVA